MYKIIIFRLFLIHITYIVVNMVFILHLKKKTHKNNRKWKCNRCFIEIFSDF